LKKSEIDGAKMEWLGREKQLIGLERSRVIKGFVWIFLFAVQTELKTCYLQRCLHR